MRIFSLVREIFFFSRGGGASDARDPRQIGARRPPPPRRTRVGMPPRARNRYSIKPTIIIIGERVWNDGKNSKKTNSCKNTHTVRHTRRHAIPHLTEL